MTNSGVEALWDEATGVAQAMVTANLMGDSVTAGELARNFAHRKVLAEVLAGLLAGVFTAARLEEVCDDPGADEPYEGFVLDQWRHMCAAMEAERAEPGWSEETA